MSDQLISPKDNNELFFTTLLIESGRVILKAYHMARLQASFAYFKIDGQTHLNLIEYKLVDASALDDHVLRIGVFRSSGNVSVSFQRRKLQTPKSSKLKLKSLIDSSWRLNVPPALKVKISDSYFERIAKSNMDDLLILNSSKDILECVNHAVVIYDKFDKSYLFPSMDNILKSLSVERFKRYLYQEKIAYKDTVVNLEELLENQQRYYFWLTNAVRGMRSVGEIDGIKLENIKNIDVREIYGKEKD